MEGAVFEEEQGMPTSQEKEEVTYPTKGLYNVTCANIMVIYELIVGSEI